MPITKLNPNQVPMAGGASGIFPAGTTLQYLRGDNVWATLPTTLPASDVYAWAKAATKPSYTYSEVGADPAGAASAVSQFLNNILYVSSTYTADGVHKFTTIATAVAAWTTGKVILLAPETFSENVTLASAGITLIGMSKSNTIIGDLTITGKDCYVKELTVSGDYLVNCQDANIYYAWIELRTCIFEGNISIGTSVIRNLYNVYFYDCKCNGANKNLVFNTDSSGSINFTNSDIQAVADEQYVLSMYEGQVVFHNCRLVYFYNLNYYNITQLAAVRLTNCPTIWIKTDFVTQTTNSNYANFTVVGGQLQKRGAYTGAWTFNGLFELNILNCNFFYPDIVFNSTANSRISNVIGLGYLSPYTISGTGFTNLYIQSSKFHCVAPNLPVGHDVDNQWEVFLDG